MPKSSAKQPAHKVKKPISPFIRFSKVTRLKLKEENPHMDFVSLSKLVGVKWQELTSDEKEKYVLEYKKDLKNFKIQEEQLKEQLKEWDSRPSMVRKQDNRSKYRDPGSEQLQASSLEQSQWLSWYNMPPAASTSTPDSSQQNMGMAYHPPPLTPVSLETNNLDYVPMNYGYTPYALPEPGKATPIPTGIYVSEYYQELLASSEKTTADVEEIPVP